MCASCGAPTRVGHQLLEDGRKVADLPQVQGEYWTNERPQRTLRQDCCALTRSSGTQPDGRHQDLEDRGEHGMGEGTQTQDRGHRRRRARQDHRPEGPAIRDRRNRLPSSRCARTCPIGAMVTSAAADVRVPGRLIAIALPRVRDFRGISPRALTAAEYTLGLRDQLIFPEIDYMKRQDPRDEHLGCDDRPDERRSATVAAVAGMPFGRTDFC